MKKESLFERCASFDKAAENDRLWGYPRESQKEIVRISTAIIKAICNEGDVTPSRAKLALEMAVDIINRAGDHEPIS